MKDWLTFEKLFTPKIVTLVFWVASGGMVLVGLLKFIRGVRYELGAESIEGLVQMVVGPVVLRVILEAVVVVFRTHGITVTGGMPDLGMDEGGSPAGSAPPPGDAPPPPPPPSAPQGPPM